MFQLPAARLARRANAEMQHLKQIVKALLAGESGQDMVEYALVAVFIGLAGVALLSGLESTLAGTFNRFGNVLTSSV